MNREELLAARKAANAAIKPCNIHGKEYAEVAERVAAFRAIYPEGFISTTFKELDKDWCVCYAYVSADDKTPLATGTACEFKSSSNINKTSYIENCETSAVGRALGFLGIGSGVSIASYEEVKNAITTQAEQKAQVNDDATVERFKAWANATPQNTKAARAWLSEIYPGGYEINTKTAAEVLQHFGIED